MADSGCPQPATFTFGEGRYTLFMMCLHGTTTVRGGKARRWVGGLPAAPAPVSGLVGLGGKLDNVASPGSLQEFS